MCNPAIPYVMMAMASAAQGVQAYEQGKFENDVSKFNAREQQNEATNTRNKSVEEENKQRRMTAELISKQRTESAAQGVDVDSGSAFQLQQDSAMLGEVDAMTIKNNFDMRADMLESQAVLTRKEGKNALHKGKVALGVGMLSAAAQGAQGANAAGGGGVDPSWYSSTQRMV